MKQKLFMMLAALMLMGTGAMAQSETLKGDVNADGVVDVADIAAVIKIMAQDVEDEPGETKYYWYIGQENPLKLGESFNPASVVLDINDRTTPGWRLIGTELPSSETKLFDESETINFGAQVIHYIAIPLQTLKLTSGGIDVTAEYALESTIAINGVIYYIYKSKDTLRRYGYTTLMSDNGSPIYYWYVGNTSPEGMTPPSVGNANSTLCQWTSLGTSLPTTSIKVYKGDVVNYDDHTWYIAAPTAAGFVIWNGLNSSEDLGYSKVKTFMIGDVSYDLFKSKGVSDQSVVYLHK